MIKITKEIELKDFETWAGATDTVKHLTTQELEIVEQNLRELQYGGLYSDLTETELNDFLWFEVDLIAEWLGYDSFDDILERE